MFFSKKQREADREIMQHGTVAENDGEQGAVIKVKVQSREQLFSPYSYSGDKLNPEFCGYIFDKAKSTSLTEDLTICVHSDEEISSDEVQSTLKNHYADEYRETKKDLRRLTVISLIMTAFGIITLTVLVLLNHFWDNFYVTTIVEIAAWVFVWEAVDYFFLQRPVVKAKLLLIRKIYSANVEALITGKGQ